MHSQLGLLNSGGKAKVQIEDARVILLGVRHKNNNIQTEIDNDHHDFKQSVIETFPNLSIIDHGVVNEAQGKLFISCANKFFDIVNGVNRTNIDDLEIISTFVKQLSHCIRQRRITLDGVDLDGVNMAIEAIEIYQGIAIPRGQGALPQGQGALPQGQYALPQGQDALPQGQDAIQDGDTQDNVHFEILP